MCGGYPALWRTRQPVSDVGELRARLRAPERTVDDLTGVLHAMSGRPVEHSDRSLRVGTSGLHATLQIAAIYFRS